MKLSETRIWKQNSAALQTFQPYVPACKIIEKKFQPQDEMNENLNVQINRAVNLKKNRLQTDDCLFSNGKNSTMDQKCSSENLAENAANTLEASLSVSTDKNVYLNKKLQQLTQKQELEKQMLIQKFNHEKQQLIEQHEKAIKEKIRNHIQVQELVCGRALGEDKQELKVEALKNKDKDSHSATASSEVKMHLSKFILKRKQESYENGNRKGNDMNSGPTQKTINWNVGLNKFHDDLAPLRKTASEPNLKVRSALKQKVIDKRCSPLLRRKTKRLSKGLLHFKQNNNEDHNTHSSPVSASSSMESSTPPNSKPESIPGSPPAVSGGSIITGNSASSSYNQNEPNNLTSNSPINDLQIYSSPSLPNISLNKPHLTSNLITENSKFIDRQRAGRFYHFCPSLPAIENSPPSSPTFIHNQMVKQRIEQKLEKETALKNINNSFLTSNLNTCNEASFLKNNVDNDFTIKPILQNLDFNPDHNQREQKYSYQEAPFTEALSYTPNLISIKSLRKPLNRTQSAPLPFNLLQVSTLATAPVTLETNKASTSETSNVNIQQTVKERIRQTVLNRTAIKQKLNSANFDEEILNEIPTNCDKTISQYKEKVKNYFNEENLNQSDASKWHNFSNKKKYKSFLQSNQLLAQIQQKQILQSLQQQLIAIEAAAKASSQPNASSVDISWYHQLLLQYKHQLFMIQQQHSELFNDLPTFPVITEGQNFVYPDSQLHSYTHLLSKYPQTVARPLQRTLSSPMVSFENLPSNQVAAVAVINAAFDNQQLNENEVSSRNLIHNFCSLNSIASKDNLINLSHGNLNLISQTPPNSPELFKNQILSQNNSFLHASKPVSDSLTAIITDECMLKHDCICGQQSTHLENSERLTSILKRLYETDLINHCHLLPSRKATIEELESVHGYVYCQLFGSDPLNRQKIDNAQRNELPVKSFERLPCGGIGVDSDTTWNDNYTWSAARTAVGCVLELATRVACGEYKNGFAFVRPPGHHAEHQQPMGFCYFNSIAIAAQQLKLKLKLNRILILDWDVHHGNGTQQAFYDDDQVLYISLHRHDQGNFFPGTGDASEVGSKGASLGKTVNIAWSGGVQPYYGDAEYLAAFRTIVLPIIAEWQPQIVLVSCGFDSADGHSAPLGGYHLSSAMFAWMTNEVSKLCSGQIVLALEGGYQLNSICDCAEEVVKALLGLPFAQLSVGELNRRPNSLAVETLHKIYDIHKAYWTSLKRYIISADCSHLEAAYKLQETEAVCALASLTVRQLGSLDCKSQEEDEPMEQDSLK